jgi:DNA-binding IclR family transcriptional regulator
LGSLYRQGFDSETTIRQTLARIAAQLGETASFYIRAEAERVCLYRAESGQPLRYHVAEGSHRPLSSGASGKVLRAFSGARGGALAVVRRQGYALVRGEVDPALASLAVPLLLAEGHLYGAIAISGPITRFTPAMVRHAARLLQEETAGLAAALAGGGGR